jgi:hypothetical protein
VNVNGIFRSDIIPKLKLNRYLEGTGSLLLKLQSFGILFSEWGQMD